LVFALYYNLLTSFIYILLNLIHWCSYLYCYNYILQIIMAFNLFMTFYCMHISYSRIIQKLSLFKLIITAVIFYGLFFFIFLIIFCYISSPVIHCDDGTYGELSKWIREHRDWMQLRTPHRVTFHDMKLVAPHESMDTFDPVLNANRVKLNKYLEEWPCHEAWFRRSPQVLATMPVTDAFLSDMVNRRVG